MPERVDWRLGKRCRRYSVAVPSRFESTDFPPLHAAALAGMGLLVTLATAVADDQHLARALRP